MVLRVVFLLVLVVSFRLIMIGILSGLIFLVGGLLCVVLLCCLVLYVLLEIVFLLIGIYRCC